MKASDVEKALAACPDAEWRTIVALARYSGLRTTGETLSLRWHDLDWEHGRMRVKSTKTEHRQGKAFRVVPLFPEVRPHLEALFRHNNADRVFVVERREWLNLRTTMEKIVERAGLQPWPKLFHELRASRDTELCRRHPLHVVCEWIDNSPTIAGKHDLPVTDADFDAALQSALQQAPESMGTGRKSEQPDPTIRQITRIPL